MSKSTSGSTSGGASSELDKLDGSGQLLSHDSNIYTKVTSSTTDDICRRDSSGNIVLDQTVNSRLTLAEAVDQGTTKGDLNVYNGSSYERLGVSGAEDDPYILLPDPNASSGLKWKQYKNMLVMLLERNTALTINNGEITNTYTQWTETSTLYQDSDVISLSSSEFNLSVDAIIKITCSGWMERIIASSGAPNVQLWMRVHNQTLDSTASFQRLELGDQTLNTNTNYWTMTDYVKIDNADDYSIDFLFFAPNPPVSSQSSADIGGSSEQRIMRIGIELVHKL